MIRSVKYFYTTNNLACLREKYNLSVCFNPHINFIKNQKTIAKGLSNRIAIRSNFIKSYRQLKFFYIARLRKIFLNINYVDRYSFRAETQTADISFFLNTYKQFKSLNCLDRALLWRATQINSIFNITHVEKKKKKKLIYSSRISFTTPHKRILTVWKWLNVFIKTFVEKDKKWGVALLPGLDNFLMSPTSKHVLSDVKLQVYKLQLLRTS